MPTRNASARTGIVSVKEATSAMKKASTPAVMQPLFGLSDSPAERSQHSRASHVISAGFGARLPSTRLLPHAALSAYCGNTGSTSRKQHLLPLRQQASKRSLHLVAVL